MSGFAGPHLTFLVALLVLGEGQGHFFFPLHPPRFIPLPLPFFHPHPRPHHPPFIGGGGGGGEAQEEAANNHVEPKPGVAEHGFIEGKSAGAWELFVADSGVSAMHMQIMPNNMAIVYDAASLGPSKIQLPPNNCRTNIPAPTGPVTDCFAHGVKVDTITGQVKVLKVTSDIWCSSGGLNPEGVLVSTGGFADGIRSLRYVGDCDTCDFIEPPIKLADERWYGTQVQLGTADLFVLIGGRRAFNYEFVVPEGKPNPRPGRNDLNLLVNTTDMYENNLYPFVVLAPTGNLFVLANFKSIMLDPFTNKVVREYPDLPGGARNYPGSAGSTLLPLKLKPGQKDAEDIEIIVCGGGQPLAFGKAEKENIFLPTLDTCGRMKFMQGDAAWDMETMPSHRVMGDMLNLPNGHILILNGAMAGSSGWYDAKEPNFTPVLYRPKAPKGTRFQSLEPSKIARMYHSSSALLVSGKVLVGGSNPNQNYVFEKADFPTELRMEKFSPPYLDKDLDQYRPALILQTLPQKVTYGQSSIVSFKLNQPGVVNDDLTVILYKPPFTTHGYSMNQRVLELPLLNLKPSPGQYCVTVEMPNGPNLAPPGYYNLFVTYRGVPGEGSWIRLMP